MRFPALARVLALAAALAVAGCGGAPSGSWARSLLARGPDGVTDAEGRAFDDAAETSAVVADPAARRLEIGSGATVVYRVESPRAVSLALEGEADAFGSFALSLHVLDERRSERLARVAPSVDMSTRAVKAKLQLGAVPDGYPFELELSWKGPEGSRLSFETIELVDARPAPPPILFVSADTLTARHLSIYGYDRETSPNLARFADEAVTFERAIANAPWTRPSYISQFSGLYPSASGEDPDPRDGPRSPELLQPGHWALAECLRAGGYRTASFTGNPFFRAGQRLDQGFDATEAGTGKSRRLVEVVPDAYAWLDALRPGDAPFLFVNAMDTHGPYAPPPPFRGAFADDVPGGGRTALVTDGPRYMGMIPQYIVREWNEDGTLPAELPVDVLVAAYDEEILGLDAKLGELFDRWKAVGLWDRSVIVFSADHGESMGVHDWLFDHSTLYGEVTHVPLLVKLPGGAHAGRRVSTAVQLVDLYPTLVELAGLPVERRMLHGRSLVGLATGAARPEERPILSEGGALRGTLLEHDGWRLIETRLGHARPAVMLTHPRGKAWLAERVPVLASFRPGVDQVEELERPFAVARAMTRLAVEMAEPHFQLHDLANDPDELVDVAERHPERVAELRALLEVERERARAARVAEAAEPAAPTEAELDELRDVGYFGDE